MPNLNWDMKWSQFSCILFVYNLMVGCVKTNRDNYPGICFWTKEKEIGFKFNPWPGLALIGLRTTGSRTVAQAFLLLASERDKRARKKTKMWKRISPFSPTSWTYVRGKSKLSSSETLREMGTSFGFSDFLDRLCGAALVMIGRLYSWQPFTNHS